MPWIVPRYSLMRSTTARRPWPPDTQSDAGCEVPAAEARPVLTDRAPYADRPRRSTRETLPCATVTPSVTSNSVLSAADPNSRRVHAVAWAHGVYEGHPEGTTDSAFRGLPSGLRSSIGECAQNMTPRLAPLGMNVRCVGCAEQVDPPSHGASTGANSNVRGSDSRFGPRR